MSDMEYLYETDPEFMERFDAFALHEVVSESGQQLDDTTRYMAILATLIGCQGVDEYKIMLPHPGQIYPETKLEAVTTFSK